MPTWLTVVLALGGTALIGSIVVNIINFFSKKQVDKYEKEKATMEKERVEELKNIINEAIKPISDDMRLLRKSNQALLRSQLYELYDAWEPKGYAPRDVQENFENLYINYHSLGKNGVMDAKHEEFMRLPNEKPKTTTKKKQVLNEDK